MRTFCDKRRLICGGGVQCVKFMLRVLIVLWVVLSAGSGTVLAQFKEIGPPPVSAAVARQEIRTLLEKVDFSNQRETIDKISGLLVWYRDLADEELIAAWKGDGRARLPQVLESLADAQVASAIIEYSWRQQRHDAFTSAYAPTLIMLMSRYPASAKPFLDDLLGRAAAGGRMPDLEPSEAEAVCRILLDMPDIGTWRKDALEILPHYRPAAENLLAQDLHSGDGEKSTRAQFWLADLKWGSSAAGSGPSSPRHGTLISRGAPVSQGSGSLPPGVDSPVVSGPPVSTPAPPPPEHAQPASLAPAPPAPQAEPGHSTPAAFDRVQSGTLQCVGAPVPQNAEYVFRNIPPGRMELDYDTKTWDAHLLPGDGQTQKLVLRNKSTGPQKRCVVHWKAIP
jgi:hypothetical protein